MKDSPSAPSTPPVALCTVPCPACANQTACEFHMGSGPLAMIFWPGSKQAALEMPTLPLEYVRCLSCGHIYNRAFRYSDVPYTTRPNLMFNQGSGWGAFIEARVKELSEFVPSDAIVVEIGYGDGSFLAAMAARIKSPDVRFVGFDPHGAALERGRAESNTIDARITLRKELFNPFVHVPELRPKLIVMRHVLEHMTNPLGFLQSIRDATTGCVRPDDRCYAYIEVPCVDNMLASGRTSDLYYEHASQFTSGSFKAMVKALGEGATDLGFMDDAVSTSYGGEVIHGLVWLHGSQDSTALLRETLDWRERSEGARSRMKAQLQTWLERGRKFAIWGGVGKSAALMHQLGLDAERFPLVVDSDPAKVGTHVPGLGQRIESPDLLADLPGHTILISTAWRAGDICAEIRRRGLTKRPRVVLFESGGRLEEVQL